jgi:hypothetical protein
MGDELDTRMPTILGWGHHLPRDGKFVGFLFLLSCVFIFCKPAEGDRDQL